MAFQIFTQKNKDQFFIILSFFAFFVIGLIIFKDYGLSNDEPFQRTIGYYWLIALLKKFSSNVELINFLEEKFQLMYWADYINNGNLKQYGILFDTFAAFVEELFKVNDSQNAFHLKHFLTFFLFFISSIFFYKIILNRFNKKYFALLIYFFYISSPRIFAESFYNCKDIVFMSITVFSIYYAFKCLDKLDYKNISLFCFFSAFATNVRIMGLLIFFLFLIFILLNYLENKKFIKKDAINLCLIISIYPIILFSFWPFLWDAPLTNFLYTLKSFANFNMSFDILYLGEYYNITNLPWHYIPIWILATTPLLYLVFFFLGFYKIGVLFFKNFLNLSDRNKLWKNKDQKKDFFILFFFLIPIFLVIFLNSTLYSGWRHLYFIYPCLVYLVAVGIEFLLKLKNFKIDKKVIIFFVMVLLSSNLYNLIKLHPYQNIYFNFLFEKKANDLFEIDYWGLGNKEALEFIKKNENNNSINIRIASFSPIIYSDLILKESVIGKSSIVGTTEQNLEYIFTNYIFDKNPKYEKKYSIPVNYDKIFTLKRGNITINEVFKKRE